MDLKTKALVVLLVSITFLSLGISYLQYIGLDGILSGMSTNP